VKLRGGHTDGGVTDSGPSPRPRSPSMPRTRSVAELGDDGREEPWRAARGSICEVAWTSRHPTNREGLTLLLCSFSLLAAGLTLVSGWGSALHSSGHLVFAQTVPPWF